MVRRCDHPAVYALFVSAALHALLLLVAAGWFVAPSTLPPDEYPTRRFVKRLPPTHRPLARHQLTRSVQRPLVRRPAACAAPAVAVSPAPLTTQRQLVTGLPVPIVTVTMGDRKSVV